jgi:GT2 family glycosyltransferase
MENLNHVKRWPKVSVILVNANMLHHLKRCLPSLYEQQYSNYEVLLVDNHSTDGSVEFVRAEFPAVKVIENEANLGYAAGNNVGFKHADGAYVCVLNPDTHVAPDMLAELVRAMEADPGTGLATSRILLMDQPQSINTCGNEITFTGLTFCRGLNQPMEKYPKHEYVSAVSGAAFLIRRDVLEEIGGFDEDFFTYYEETDLSLRALLAGYKILYAPSSILWHQYAFRYSAQKNYYQERNRYYSLLKTLRFPTLLALLPGLLLSELISWGYSVLKGKDHLASKLRSHLWILKNWKKIMQARKEVQKLRRVPDRAILSHFGYRIGFTQTTRPELARLLETILSPLVYVYGNLVRLVVRW